MIVEATPQATLRSAAAVELPASNPRALAQSAGEILRRGFGWRDHFGFGWLEAVLLAIYSTLLLLVIPHHELWADSGQAWLIARDNSVWQILRYRLHYEGAPPLWHLTLHLFHLLHGSYPGISYLGAAFACVGVAVFLRWAPFPLIVRALLPFTFFLQFQYAVIARSYVLFPLLCFALCILFTKPRRFVWFLLTAGMLANLCMQGTIFSFLTVALSLADAFRDRHYTHHKASSFRRRLTLAAALYLPLLALASVVALPAPDVYIAVDTQVASGFMHDLLVHFPGETRRTQAIPPADPALPPEPVPAEPSWLRHPDQWLAWYAYFANARPDGTFGPMRWTQTLDEFVLGSLAQATWPVSTSKLLACVFLGVLVFWLHALRGLRFLIPWVMLILVGQILWVADHHAGMLMLALIAAIWLARTRKPAAFVPARLDRTLILLLAVICALQIQWTWVSMRKDVQGSYDPGPQTARWLMAHPRPRMAAFDFLSVSIQPWYPHSPFFNEPTAYWRWSSIDDVNLLHQQTIASHPDLAVVPVQFLQPGLMHNEWAPLSSMTSPQEERDQHRNPIVNDLRAHGYVETHRFCGTRWSRLESSYRNCDLIFEPGPRKP